MTMSAQRTGSGQAQDQLGEHQTQPGTWPNYDPDPKLTLTQRTLRERVWRRRVRMRHELFFDRVLAHPFVAVVTAALKIRLRIWRGRARLPVAYTGDSMSAWGQ